MSKSHVKGNSNITYQSKSILSLFRVHLSLKGAASGARQLSEVWNSQEPIPTTTGHVTYKDELEPEQQEAHENMEPTGADDSRRQSKKERLPFLVVYKSRVRSCRALPKEPHTFSWTDYQKCLYWMMYDENPGCMSVQ
uniref:Uncharacterized protein n=1 Tax=Monodon monoceros TaxID=40151 RepID=A0A8C6B380_MONMO